MTAILGAGISGLSAAYYALQNPKLASIVILEASNRVGGWIRSVKQPDGTIFEQGPRTIATKNVSGKNTLELMEQMRLSNKIIPITQHHVAANKRFIYANNQLHSIHFSPTEIFKKNPLLNRSMFSIILHDLTTRKVPKDDESVYSFAERRFGKDVAENIISALICGIYAGDAREISVKPIIDGLFEAEQKYGSVLKGVTLTQYSEYKKRRAERIKAKLKPQDNTNKESHDLPFSLVGRAKREMWKFWGIEGGLEQLPQALATDVTKRGVNLEMEHKCERLRFNKDHVELIVNGEARKYSRVISSLPARSLAPLVEEQHPTLSKELRDIPTVTVGVVNLQFSGDVLPINGFGILIPPKEEIPILGVIFDSCTLPQNSKSTVLTAMMGGAWFEKYFGNCSSKNDLLNIAVNQVTELLRIEEEPKAFNVSILKDCIPQYTVGHMERVTSIRNYISKHNIPLSLCGSSYQGVGVNDAILSARQAVSGIN